MIHPKTIQLFLRSEDLYRGAIDGDLGAQSYGAIIGALAEWGQQCGTWTRDRLYVAVQQLMFRKAGLSEFEVGPIDGYIGPRFAYAFEHWQDLQRVVPMWVDDTELSKRWPKQADVPHLFGEPGENLVWLTLPYAMKLAWDPSQVVKRIQCNKNVKDSLEAVLHSIYIYYGPDIAELGLDLYGGCFSNRPMKGNKSKLSMHAYGIALDMDPDHNSYRATHLTARFAAHTYIPFWGCWQREGWVSLGHARDMDWMHIQAARLT